MEKFTDRPDYGYYTPKTDSNKEETLKSRSPKQVIVKDMQLDRNVIVRKKKKRNCAEFVKLNSLGRREENKEPLDTRYETNDTVTTVVQENASLGMVYSGNKEEY